MEKLGTIFQEAKKSDIIHRFEKIGQKQNLCDE
jgi:hypothetical protein